MRATRWRRSVRDFGPYREWLSARGVPTEYLRVIDTELTAQAFITTDLDDNQITAFHPGAMQHAHRNRVGEARGITLGIVAPDGREGHARACRAVCQRRHSLHFRPGPGAADVRGRGAASASSARRAG